MGCDIHLYAEEKTPKGWEPIYIPFPGRDYLLFGLLAGVRNSNIVIWGGRGMPTDLSEDVAGEFAFWEEDAHSGSWITLKELVTGLFEVIKKVGEYFNVDEVSAGNYLPAISTISTWIEELAEYKNPTRIIYWFDN